MLLIVLSGAAVLLLAQAFAGRLPAAVLLVPQGLLILGGLHLLLARAGERWSDVGLRALHRRDVRRAVLLLGACMGANLLLMLLISVAAPAPVLEHTQHLQTIAVRLAGGLPVPLIAGLMFFVGVYEELVARGFLLARCRTALDGMWAPVLLSSALFGLGHLYQGWIGVLQTMLIGLLFAGYTLRWGTLWPAILAHAGLNTLTVVLLERLRF
jgi:membrane protease YdiL (CAAX protease family)